MQRDSEVRVVFNNKISYCTKRGCKTCFPPKSSPSICPETLGQETEVESLKVPPNSKILWNQQTSTNIRNKIPLQRNIIIILITHHKFYWTATISNILSLLP